MRYLFGREILNFIGGTLRWVYGSVWRTIFNKPKFKFSEYINGPDNPDYYDVMGHNLNNMVIAIIFFTVLIAITT